MSVSFLDPETDIIDQSLDPKTDVMGEQNFKEIQVQSIKSTLDQLNVSSAKMQTESVFVWVGGGAIPFRGKFCEK